MKSKPGSAMVEMQGQEAVARVMQVVTGLEVFGSKITPKSVHTTVQKADFFEERIGKLRACLHIKFVLY